MDLLAPLSQAQAQRFLQFMAMSGAPMPQARLHIKSELILPDLLVAIHGYWKSKVYELHRDWKEVTDEIDIDTLDKRDIDAEKEYSEQKMPIFKLGDRVRIVGGDMRMFKILHKKVGIWKTNLKPLIGKEAIVMNLSSHFAVSIALLENGNLFQINGYALEKINSYSEEGIWANETPFKRNDEVVIGVDNSVLAHLQVNSRKTPIHVAAQLRGYIGRVMCCYQEEVVVTFDEIRHEVFNPAALSHYEDDENGKAKKHMKTAVKDIIPLSRKVRVKLDGDEVIKLQRGHGEWNYKMTKFVGKEGVVIDNKENADVIVKFSPFESYRMNRDTFQTHNSKKARNRSISGSASFGKKPFAVGDILQLNLSPMDLGFTLQLLRIPVEFLSVISEHMTFVGYEVDSRFKDDVKAVVDIGNGRELIMEIHHLQKIENMIDILDMKEADKAIKVGSKVQLFTGPKSYVKHILKNIKPGFEKALDHLGTIVGYDKSGNAVIKYDDNKLYSVPDEHICSPRSHWNKSVADGVNYFSWEKKVIRITSPGSVSALEAKVLNTVTKVLKKTNGPNAGEWTAKTRGTTGDEDSRIIAVTLPAFPDDFNAFEKQLKDALQLKSIRFEKQSNNSFTVSGDQSRFTMVFCKEGSNEINLQQVEETVEKDIKPPPSVLGRSLSINDVISEPQTTGNAAVPFATGPLHVPIPEGVGQIVLQVEGARRHPQGAFQAAQAQPANGTNVVVQGGSATINVNSGVQDNSVTINESSVRSVQVHR